MDELRPKQGQATDYPVTEATLLLARGEIEAAISRTVSVATAVPDLETAQSGSLVRGDSGFLASRKQVWPVAAGQAELPAYDPALVSESRRSARASGCHFRRGSASRAV